MGKTAVVFANDSGQLILSGEVFYSHEGGNLFLFKRWIPAFAGMTNNLLNKQGEFPLTHQPIPPPLQK